MPRQTKRGATLTQMTQLIQQHVQGAMVNSLVNDGSNESPEDSDLEEAIVAFIMLKRCHYHAP
ncbi:uncharacterized protein PGTG_13649 [Puccinia graminis f. sp. tritici CRL 75-36-700-3]|uniref:Uncharacterized protein n=1 Tax=Puccinia graminis f. sp. tritici (strain CRL 75-36-700-3 / race SCCL) TaxID=418459 RepID=E3KT35_PUCGT|nr:uncharacterized protein PGTG_13649 [Puccinia graminis f. sp. tritici CRL 75-36-700-3]EFP87421.2 hypothetical protein PGTG_13649 [Puccinia graminis f. sp. tritici CRL 75-36-700-3]